MAEFDPYIIVIVVCSIVIVSFLFSQLSRRTNIPSVLMLILLGMGLRVLADQFDFKAGESVMALLEILGIAGLIMIVLEAALDLKLTREKRPLILRSFFLALLALIATSMGIAWLLSFLLFDDLITGLVYAIPLAVVSSAIVIPSVANLAPGKREFLIYDSALSDIMGIMLFYFFIEGIKIDQPLEVVWSITSNIGLTVLLSVALSYLLVAVIQWLSAKEKLFFLIAILFTLYSVGKLAHLSALMIILVFGLILNNYKLFFPGRLQKFLDADDLNRVLDTFHVVTVETAFVVRTFFFVVFGFTIEIGDLLSLETALIGAAVTAVIFGVRYIGLLLLNPKNIMPELFVAPRGLITILLFYGIPASMVSDKFSSGILLYTILLTSGAMAVALILKGQETDPVAKLNFEDWEELDQEIEKLKQRREQVG